jgi:hypothetical protein
LLAKTHQRKKFISKQQCHHWMHAPYVIENESKISFSNLLCTRQMHFGKNIIKLLAECSALPQESTTIHIIHINIFNFLINYLNKYNTTCLIKSSRKQSKEQELHAKKFHCSTKSCVLWSICFLFQKFSNAAIIKRHVKTITISTRLSAFMEVG